MHLRRPQTKFKKARFMKKILLISLLLIALLLSSCNLNSPNGDTESGGNNILEDTSHAHTDTNEDTKCDVCKLSVLIELDFYAINDLHGKIADSDSQPGVDELTTFLKNSRANDSNVVLLCGRVAPNQILQKVL